EQGVEPQTDGDQEEQVEEAAEEDGDDAAQDDGVPQQDNDEVNVMAAENGDNGGDNGGDQGGKQLDFTAEGSADTPDECVTGRVRNPRADLSVTKVVDDPTPEEGQIVTFTITVTNEGPDDADDVALRDVLPAGLSYVAHAES